ncbi:MAG: ABC transporter permease [Phototrophicales bacterium]|nr:MAG: ABC transporter permease [Phototrophicales bacterium]
MNTITCYWVYLAIHIQPRLSVHHEQNGAFLMEKISATPILSSQRQTTIWRIGRIPKVFNPTRWMWLMSLLLVLGLWQLITALSLIQPFLLPPPIAVIQEFGRVINNGTLWKHTSVTLGQVIPGLLIGVMMGMMLGYGIAKIRILEALLAPIIVAFQSVPVVAYAPLLVVWFGSGGQSKIITCALIVFFPILMNTVTGIRSVPREWREVMRVYRANHWQTFRKLEIPAALPILLTGLKTSATLAVIGSVVGEFIVANAGLGMYINLARTQYNTPLVFVCAITMALMAGGLYGLVSILERKLLAWRSK